MRTVLYSLFLLWFLSGLVTLQTPLVSDGYSDAANQAAALPQEQANIQPEDSQSGTQNNNLTAPVRAILTPALYFSSKALPFNGNSNFLVPVLFTLLAAFCARHFAHSQNNTMRQRLFFAARSRAPPAGAQN
ncbi:hypothetical protein [Pseudochrobactrum sp. HB0163]|uniref:hypothetical protein n=1 Tax=Pseudochrobactrum sp. HB0163 TaxID=3450708 RepID=UPI003F6DD931